MCYIICLLICFCFDIEYWNKDYLLSVLWSSFSACSRMPVFGFSLFRLIILIRAMCLSVIIFSFWRICSSELTCGYLPFIPTVSRMMLHEPFLIKNFIIFRLQEEDNIVSKSKSVHQLGTCLVLLFYLIRYGVRRFSWVGEG